MIYRYKQYVPIIHPSSFIHPLAAVTGNVTIGKDCYVGPGAALRGDWGAIIIEDGCNVQENCTIHMFPGVTVLLKAGSHIGHGAIIHGATIGKNCLIGMNAVVMDDVDLGDESIVGALTLVTQQQLIPARSVVVGNPGKIIKQVTDKMLEWKTEGTELYQRLPQDMHDQWQETEPLTKPDPERPEKQKQVYKPFKKQ